MNFSKFALNNKTLIIFLICVLCLGGVSAFYKMSKLEDPEIKVKQAMVATVYPGASAHQVELEVTDLIEKSIRTMDGVKNVQSRSLNDVSQITVELQTTIQNKDIQQYWDLLRRKVADVQSQLPAGARPSVVLDNFGDVFGMFYAITSDGIDDQELYDYAQMIKREIQEFPEVSRVEIYGQQKECINIEIQQDKMANLGVHPAEILSTLNNQNKTVYPGYFETGTHRLRLAVNDTYKNVNDISELIIQGHEKDQLKLKDIAIVSVGYEEPSRNSMRYDKEKALGLAISMQSGNDITKLGKKVEEKMKELETTRIPAGIDFHRVFFQPERVTDAINTFLINLLESVVIVVFVLMLTMGLKSGLIIGASLLIIVLGSFVVLNIFDGTLQRVSLGALIVAMGMLVDNAIVIIDGILVDLKKGVKKPEALTRIGEKTAMPLLGATLIATLAFFPIFLSPDTAGLYVRDLFIVLAVSLLLSWILALTHIPIHAGFSLRTIKPDEPGKGQFDSKAYRMLRTFLTYVLSHKMATIVIAFLLLSCSAYLYKYIPKGFFPDLAYDQLYIEYNLPEGTSNKVVDKELSEIEDYLHKRQDVTHVTTSLGGTPARYNLVRSIADPSMAYGELIVDFKTPKDLVKAMPQIQEYLNDNYPDAFIRLKRYNLMYKKFPIEVMFSGPDPKILKELAAKAENIMHKEPSAVLIANDWEPMAPTLLVDYNQPVARDMGVSRSDVGMSILSATDGLPTGIYSDGIYKKNIYFKTVDSKGNPIEAVDNTPVWSMIPPFTNILNKETLQGIVTGGLKSEDLLERVIGSYPLNQATNGIKIKWEDPVVRRYNGQRAIKVQCNNADGFMAEEVRSKLAKEIDKIELPVGYSRKWLGEAEASGEALQYLFANLPLAIVLMFLIMIMLFKDVKKPLIIILCLPLIAVGIVICMLISGKAFGFVAIVGALGLIGMMIKNGIVLIDEINNQIGSGVEPMQALLDSSSSRFRPVMMASVTTILGMLPLLFDDMFGSMAVTIMGGLGVGTLITLIFIPVLYAVFFKIPCSEKEKEAAKRKQERQNKQTNA